MPSPPRAALALALATALATAAAGSLVVQKAERDVSCCVCVCVWRRGVCARGGRSRSTPETDASTHRSLLPRPQVIIHMQVVDIRTRYTFSNTGKEPAGSVIVCTEPELAPHLAFFEVRVLMGREACVFGASPPACLATSLACTTGALCHKPVQKGRVSGGESLPTARRGPTTTQANTLFRDDFPLPLSTQVLPQTEDGGTLSTAVIAPTGAPNGTMCVAVTLPAPIAPGATGGVDAFGSHVRAQAPKPATIARGDPQRVKLAYSHVVVSPYVLKEQTTKVRELGVVCAVGEGGREGGREGGCAHRLLLPFTHALPSSLPSALPARPQHRGLCPQAPHDCGRHHPDARPLHRHARVWPLARVGVLRQQRAVHTCE